MKSPFKFLDSYTKDDREIFFGRDREIEELYHKVFESKIMLVYGVSGTGKSSLIHCGLANKFQETDWLPLVIRRGGNIIESMSAAVKTASITTQQEHLITPPDFKKGVRSLYLDYYKPVFFIFDQFEELFIFGDREERRSFIHIVKTLTESDLQCRMIFVMREEYMAWVTEFEKFISNFFSNRVRIEKMSHRNALDAIKGPCKVFNINLEEGFAEFLLEKLNPGSEDVELTYLQVFLDKIFRLATGVRPPLGSLSRDSGRESKGGSASSPFDEPVPAEGREGQGDVSFTLSLLQKTGNVSDLLGSFLEEQLKALDEPDTGLSILKSFVSLRGTKRQLSDQEVIDSSRAFGKDISPDKVSLLLQKFVNLRILRDKDENGKYELRHDSLAMKIFEKITVVEKELMEINQFLENAIITYQKRKILLKADDLKYIAPYEDRLFVNKEIENLIMTSKNEQNKGKRRMKRAAIAGFAAIIMISLAAIMKINHWPMSGWARNLGYLVYIIWFLPLFTFYVIKTRENRGINITFLLFTIFFLAYSYIYLKSIQTGSNEILRRNFTQTVRQADIMIDIHNRETDSLYNLLNYNQGGYSDIDTMTAGYLAKKTDELMFYIQDLKIELIKYTEKPDTMALEGKSINYDKIKRTDETNIPSQILIGSENDGKAFRLRRLIIDYKKIIDSIISDPVLKGNMERLLNTDNKYNAEDDEYERWEYYNFQTKNLAFTLIALTHFQQNIKYCESEALKYLYDKMTGEPEGTPSIKRKPASK